jgi:hypothetical protein
MKLEPTDEEILAANKALNEAEVPTNDRYFVDGDGNIHGPITITRSEFVPANKPTTKGVRKVL